MMSPKRFNSTYNGLTAAAKKVYGAVPIAEHWTIQQVLAELQRRGTSHEHRVVQGCLAVLLDNGLIRQPARGVFCREAVRVVDDAAEVTESHHVQPEKPMQQTVTSFKLAPAPAPTAAPIDRLGLLAARVAGLADTLKALASEIGDTLVEVQAQVEDNTADTEKLRQLQTLLKSLA